MTPGKKRKLRDGTTVYDVSYYEAGGRKKSKTCYSAAEARAFHAEKVREKREGVHVVNDMKFKDYAQQHRAFSSMSWRQRTIIHHESCLRNHLLPRFGNMWLSQITRESTR